MMQQQAASVSAVIGGYYQFLQDSQSWQQSLATATSAATGGNYSGFWSSVSTFAGGTSLSGGALKTLVDNYNNTGNIFNGNYTSNGTLSGGILGGATVTASGVSYAPDWGAQKDFGGTQRGYDPKNPYSDPYIAPGTLSEIWNSNIMRLVIPDMINLNLNISAV